MTERPLTVPRYFLNCGELCPDPKGDVVRWDEMQAAFDLLRQEMQREQDRLFRQVFFSDAAQ